MPFWGGEEKRRRRELSWPRYAPYMEEEGGGAL